MRHLIFFFSLVIAPLCWADPYLGLRPANKLEDGQSRGTFLGDWDRVILKIDGEGGAVVQNREQLLADHGSILTATKLAQANTQALLDSVSYEDAGPVSRILAEPIDAVSGLLLIPEFADKVSAELDLEQQKFILPLGELLVVQTQSSPELDESYKGLASRISTASSLGLDDQVLGYAGGEFTLISAANRTPTQKEILMSLGPDPENTLVITLKDGDVVIRLRDDVAPNHTARIKELAREGFYDGIVFHRVIDGFMAQTGDPTGTGTSGSGQNLNAEFSEAPFLRGTVGMARAQSPNSADSQFFIMFNEGRFLDNNYTVIGQVESGMEFVDLIKRGEPPVDPDRMLQVRVQADI